jgi:hypothetical protein
LNGDLAQGTVGREGHEVGVSGEQQRIVIALVRRQLFARGDQGKIFVQSEIVALDLFRLP